MRIVKWLFFCVLILGFLSCGKEEADNIIPSSPVNFMVNVRIQDTELTSSMKSKVFTQPRLSGEYVGYSGLLVVCSGDILAGGIYQLHAYDLCCTYEKQRSIKVEPEADGKAKCPKCGTLYNTFEGVGNPVSGPGTNNLQRYNVQPSGSEVGVFRIYH